MEEPPTRPDAMSLVQLSPEAMDRDALVLEVRRLRMRIEALREQRDERIRQIQQLEEVLETVLAGGDVVWPTGSGASQSNVWRQRAEVAEAHLAALYATRTMRLLRAPRSVYARIRSR